MRDLRIKELAQKLLDYSVTIQEGENLLIDILGEDGIPLAKEIMRQARLKKVNVFYQITDYELLRILLQDLDEEQIKRYAQIELAKMKEMDAYIGIRANANLAELTGISAEQMKRYDQYYTKPVHFEERVKNTKWCILRYPNQAMAQMSNLSTEDFEDLYFKVCNLDYEKMGREMDKLVSLMNQTNLVRIKGPGTDLTFSIKGIPAEKYLGKNNLPDGEVATAPVRDSVNGFITYNTETTYHGIKFSNIRFEFLNGKIIKAEAADHEKELNEILDSDEGARFIGEFAIGLNPYIEKTIGDTLFDEKIKGSFHFTPGDSLQESDNRNRSNIHWDIVCIQTEEYGGGEIWFDDILIRKDGRFMPEELQGLNPENLIK